MRVYCRGIARIRHSDTGEVHEIKSEDLDWHAVGGDERSMGPEIHYEALVEHPELGLLAWGLWEYPVGIENHQDTDVNGHELIDDLTYGLEHEEESPIEWVDYSVPENPFIIFMDSYHHTGDLLADHGQDYGQFLLNRMVFSHQITALEAYLGDTLINSVMKDDDAKRRLIEQDEDLKKEKFTLLEICKEPGLIDQKVREHLRSTLYHNLAKVDALYSIALGISILNVAKNRSNLFKSVILRHDCVHRNGFDKDGNKLTIFTKKFVQDTAGLIKDFVTNVEAAVNNARSKGLL